MRRFATIAATIIGVVCLSACEWEPVYLWYPKDNSKIAMNITCPSLGLENIKFQNSERDWWHNEQRLVIHKNKSLNLELKKDFISIDSKYQALLVIDLNDELPAFELGHKYYINDIDDTGYSKDFISIFINSTDLEDTQYFEKRSCSEGYIVFTSCVYNDQQYILSGNFEFIFEDAIISNGTFSDLKCLQ